MSLSERELEESALISHAHAMLDAYPLFNVPLEEWVETCRQLLAALAAHGPSQEKERT